MPTGRQIVKNVPEARLIEVVSGLVSQGAQVTTLPEPDGEWTVIAVFPVSVPAAEPVNTGTATETNE